jgi:hypothetical protein
MFGAAYQDISTSVVRHFDMLSAGRLTTGRQGIRISGAQVRHVAARRAVPLTHVPSVAARER